MVLVVKMYITNNTCAKKQYLYSLF